MCEDERSKHSWPQGIRLILIIKIIILITIIIITLAIIIMIVYIIREQALFYIYIYITYPVVCYFAVLWLLKMCII